MSDEGLIGKKVIMKDKKIGLIHGIVVDYRECDTSMKSGVICGIGFPQIKVKIKEPVEDVVWLPLQYVEIE